MDSISPAKREKQTSNCVTVPALYLTIAFAWQYGCILHFLFQPLLWQTAGGSGGSADSSLRTALSGTLSSALPQNVGSHNCHWGCRLRGRPLFISSACTTTGLREEERERGKQKKNKKTGAGGTPWCRCGCCRTGGRRGEWPGKT